MERLALKRLTASDLTLFEAMYRTIDAGNQKSINLNRDVFIDDLYPGLPSLSPTGARFPIDLDLLGPAGKPTHNLQRKILGGGGAYKNYRLNGEFIYGPEDDTARYDALQPGDLAVFEFDGELSPHAARLAIISGTSASDAALHARLDALLGNRKMAQVQPGDLLAAAEGAALPEEHSFWTIAAATGELSGITDGPLRPLAGRRRRRRPKVPKSRVQAAAQAAQEVGDLGESLVDQHLRQRETAGDLRDVVWVAWDDAFAPEDFTYRNNDESLVHLDVKTTTGVHDNPFYLSRAELEEAASVDDYRIYRLSGLKQERDDWTGELRVAVVSADWAREALAALEDLPDGLAVPTVLVEPRVLPFGAAVVLRSEDQPDL
ncbi:MAG: hypothetical protein JWM61_184 [Micrococcaceae bacterium]|nr:hypothetical protein [Micrococcaceae bacterium]